MIIINFLYFWPHFDINNNFITRIFDNNNISYTVSTTYINEVNIPKFIFIGHFITSNDMVLNIENIPANYIKILYLSEPIEHMYTMCYNLLISNHFDYVFGSINNDISKNYYKLPYYLLYYSYKGNRNGFDDYTFVPQLIYDNKYTSFYNEVNDNVKNITIESLLSKEKFCLINSHDKYNVRAVVYSKIINKFGNVITCPGMLFNNASNEELNTIGKYEYLKKFIFNICSENCVTTVKGYITEKLLESCKSGCIPIYCGNFDDIDAMIFNKDRIIFYDITDEHSVDNCINKLEELLINPDKLEQMYKLPIFLDTAHETILSLERSFCWIFTINDYNTALSKCLYNRYFKNRVNNMGLCIEIGAGNGITNNYSYYLNNTLPYWKYINIEPLDNMYDWLQVYRPDNANNINLKIAISNKSDITTIKNYYHPESNYNSGLATLTYDKDHENYLIHICTNQFTIEQIETKTYNQLFDVERINNNQNVDLLFIDVNNHVAEILEGMNGTAYLPYVIVINTVNNQNTNIQEAVIRLSNRYKLDYKYDSFLLFTLEQEQSIYKTIEPALGIGDLLTLKMYEVSNNIVFNKFIINIWLIEYHRINYINYITFIIKFINRLFNNPKFVFVYKKENELVIDRYYENINTFYLHDYYNFQITNSTDSIETENILKSDRKYIIFHCKARFDSCADDFINEINILEKFIDEYKSDYDIVLFGERIVEQNFEVKIHKIISIYEHLTKLKKNNNVIDLTSDGLYSDNTIESFEKDAKIISNAVLNVIFGYGGPLTISMAFSKNCVYYINGLIHPVLDLYMNSYSNMYRDINKFFNYIKVVELCNKYDIQYNFINTTCNATGIGDILEWLLCIKDNIICQVYINLNYFTDLYYNSNPLNMLEFRIRLIKDVIKYNNIDSNKIIFTFSNNMHIIHNILLPITLIKNNNLKLDNDDGDNNYGDCVNSDCDTDDVNNIGINSDNKSNDSYGNGYDSSNDGGGDGDGDGEYVIMHTKCRHLSSENYSLLKENVKIFCNIAKFRYRVIIMGEREFPCTIETDAHGITTVYNELLGLKNNNTVDDITVDNIYSNLNYDSYKNDVNIIKNAKYNICFGLGGQFCTSKTFGKSVIIYCSVINLLDYVNKDVFLENSYYCTNMVDFFNVISECCCDERTVNIISNSNCNIIKNSDISINNNNNTIQYNKDMFKNKNKNTQIKKSNKICIFTFHISTGDNFTMYASVCHFAQKYQKIIIYSLYRNRHTVKQLYNKVSNVKVVVIQEQDYNDNLVPDDYINKSYNYYKNKNYNVSNIDIIKSGSNAPDFSGYLFWRVFYKQIGLDYNIRYNRRFNIINRNYKREHELYDKVVKKYGYKYIFVHDHRFLDTTFRSSRPNVIAPDINIPIFHPNCNYYDAIDKNSIFANLWYNFISDNLLDYCMVIEKAYAIHISDSSFSCICPYLNLSHIKNKTIYSNLDVIDYHSTFNMWNIVKTDHLY